MEFRGILPKGLSVDSMGRRIRLVPANQKGMRDPVLLPSGESRHEDPAQWDEAIRGDSSSSKRDISRKKERNDSGMEY